MLGLEEREVELGHLLPEGSGVVHVDEAIEIFHLLFPGQLQQILFALDTHPFSQFLFLLVGFNGMFIGMLGRRGGLLALLVCLYLWSFDFPIAFDLSFFPFLASSLFLCCHLPIGVSDVFIVQHSCD